MSADVAPHRREVANWLYILARFIESESLRVEACDKIFDDEQPRAYRLDREATAVRAAANHFYEGGNFVGPE